MCLDNIGLFDSIILNYSRVEVAAKARQWPTKLGWLGRVSSELPRVGYNEDFVVRSARP